MIAPPPSTNAWRQHVIIRHSARARYARLKIQPSGRVELVMPRGMDEKAVPEILERHEAWVLRTLHTLGKQPVPAPVQAPSQVQLPAIGEHWQVEYREEDTGRSVCRPLHNGLLHVSGGMTWQPALKRWLARKGKQHLVPWLEQVSDEIGLPFQGVTVRGQRTRWGSCSSRQQINLNFGLLFLPPGLVRYLFIHELCHTRHLNHSTQYWRLVESIEPQYRSLDHALRRANSYLPPWFHAEEYRPAPSGR
jgi:predicted metal-dependent hydrolase